MKADGFEYFLKMENGKWRMAAPIERKLDDESVERLTFSNGRLFLKLNTGCTVLNTAGPFESSCGCVKEMASSARSSAQYRVCTTNFRSYFQKTRVLLGHDVFETRIDEDRVLRAAKEANLLDAVNAQSYKQAFYRIDSSETASNFIKIYSENKYDPELFIAAAKSKRDQYIVTEAQEQAEAQARLERERISLERVAAQDKAKLIAEEKRYATFRQAIKGGTETNCGPVVEVKGNLIKVYAPVQNYGNEHWIRRDQIYPAGETCQFINGQYQGK
jgi:hypothetical protein